MLNIILIALLPFLFLSGDGSSNLFTGIQQSGRQDDTGTLEKLIVADGTVSMDLNLSRLTGKRSDAKGSRQSVMRFDAVHDSFFTVLVFNNEMRGPLPSSLELIPQNFAKLPSKLNSSYSQLVIENMSWGGDYDLVIRDGTTGFIFFNIEGHEYEYNAIGHSLNISNGRLLVSKEFASELGRPSDGGAVVGNIDISANMRPIEITQVVDGEVRSEVMPAREPNAGTTPGPDAIVGDLSGLTQFGSSGTQVGLSVGTDSCNAGAVELNWIALPGNDHPVIPQNLYRMSGGAANDERFEQIGQSNLKHAFTALQNNICNLGCIPSGTGTRLGSGCSDPYSASLNSSQTGLGSRAWVNPFSGAFPRGDSATNPNSHTGHTHVGTSHRILTEMSDLNTTLNPGATYYAESQYVTPHEYAWCQSNPGQCNMYNNVSHRQYGVTGTTSFIFSPVAATVRTKSAIIAWTGATLIPIEPTPGVDGVGTLAYKVTNPSPGVYHYEYAIYNQNMDRAIQFFSIPVAVDPGATTDDTTGILTNIGFHAPPQHPGWTFDGTVGNTGFSGAPWTPIQTPSSMTWSSETFAQNPNANAIRWGTMYNFRFDSVRPPRTTTATIGFFKTGAPITVQILAPTCATAACRTDN
ncbi:MAG: hypothetical protein ABIP78_07600 [Pyrinomonadaceae bacterium]